MAVGRSFPAVRWVALWPYECVPGPGRGSREWRPGPALEGRGGAWWGRCTAMRLRGLCRTKTFLNSSKVCTRQHIPGLDLAGPRSCPGHPPLGNGASFGSPGGPRAPGSLTPQFAVAPSDDANEWFLRREGKGDSQLQSGKQVVLRCGHALSDSP